MQNIINIFNKYIQNNWFCLSGIFLICVLTVALPFLILGFTDGMGDMGQHIRFAMTYREAILNFDLFPGWANDNQGLGSIGIRFYPPLAYYFVALTHIFVGNWYDSFWINIFGWMFLGCAGVYCFAKEWVSPPVAMIGGMVYAVVPYHLMQIYQYFLFAEFAAMGILPFCFLFITRIIQREKWIDTILFAVSFGLLILTHIPSTVISVISLTVYGLMLIDQKKYKRTFTRLFIAVGLGMTAGIFHWVKVLTEVQWLTHTTEKFSSDSFYYASWLFPSIMIERNYYLFVLTSWLLDSMIVLTVLLLIPGIIYLLKGKMKSRTSTEYRLIFSITFTAFFAFFMTTKASTFVWENLTFLQKIQFPWRWCAVLSFLGVMSFILSLPRLINSNKYLARIYVYLSLSLLLAMSLFNYTQLIENSMPLSRDEFAQRINNLSSTLSQECWWPIWSKPKALEQEKRILSGDRDVVIESWESETREFMVESGQPVTARIATFYYPHWKAEINGQETEVNIGENGTIQIDIPAEKAKVKLYFVEPFINDIASLFSLITWIFLFTQIISFYRKKN